MARHLALLLFTLAGLLPMVNPPNLPAVSRTLAPLAPAALAAPNAPPPLPRSCIVGGTPLDYAQPVCCVSGYVYLNGAPLVGAALTISAGGGSLTTQTQLYPGSTLPYFSVSLGAAPLNVQPGDTVIITATASGQTKSVTFIAQEGGQQIDVVLPQSALNATWTAGEQAMPELRKAAMAYDATRKRTLLFGGLVNGTAVPSDKTWEWDGTSWLRRTPVVTPPARSAHALAYDAARQRMVLFGGIATTGITLTDTWEWDGATWLERIPSDTPTLSGPPTLVYDSLRARVLLIGASADKLATWAWDGTNWTQLTTTGAPARTSFSFTYDAGRDRVVIFGGTRAGVLQQDTWEFNGTAWVRAFPLNSPTARNGHAMTYDSVRQQVVLVGGVDATNKPLEDSWSYDGNTWAALNVDLPPRANALLTYDSARSAVVLAGGYSDAAATTYPNETWELDAIDWNQRAPQVSPSTHFYYQMAYQSSRKRVMLFGYVAPGQGGTWEWDGSTWTPRTPPANPPGTQQASMVYDEARQQVMMFGGSIGSVVNTTWIWDGHTWAERFPTASPSPRTQAGIVYESRRQRAVLFGGSNIQVRFNDTWEWDGTTWIDVTPSISPPVENNTPFMAYDPVNQQTVFLLKSSPKTMTWDGTNWTEQTSTQIPNTNSVLSGPMAYDSARQRIVLLNKDNVNGVWTSMWEWDGRTWTRRDLTTGQSIPVSFKVTAIPDQQLLMLLGNTNDTSWSTLNTTWLWNGTSWHEQPNDSYVPGQRTAAAMDYTRDGFSLLFGGRAPDASLSGRTFHWQGNRWLMLDPATMPLARQAHQIARNSDGSLLLMFGGKDAGGGYLDDTWLWNGSEWQLQAPTNRPTARADYSLSYDTRRNVWVLFGGQNSSARLNDTWEYDGSAWYQRSPLNAPPARAGATLTYDQRRGVAVLVGGQSGSALNDVWEYDGTTWANVTSAQPLAARTGHGAAYDPSRGVVLVTGGLDETGAVRGDTWEWNGAFWRERIAATPLTARAHMAVAYDTERGELVAFGGEDASGVILSDTQLHQASGSLSVPIPIATISRITPRDARQGVDTISFEGRGADADSSDVINAYRWTINGAEISTAASFTKAAADLPVGVQTVRFAVQDNEGDWSLPVEQTIIIRTRDGGMVGNQRWTLLIYAVADNNLDPYMGENSALNGMLYRLKNAGALSNVQVGMLYDGPGANDTRRYILKPDGPLQPAEPLPEARMDEMETLRDFVRWGYATFQSDYYALSLVDHANGVVGFGQDNTSDGTGKAFLTPIELRTALQQATDNGTRKLDVLHVDGCSFGLLEDAAIAAELAQYLIVSPNTGWGVFAYERYRQLAGQSADPRTYAEAVAQTYASAVGAHGLPYTVSVFDMARFADLNQRVSTFGNQLLAYTQADLINHVEDLRILRNASQRYDSGGVYLEIDPEDSYVDLTDFATRVQATVGDANVQSAARAVIDAVQGSAGNAPFVIYEAHASGQFVSYDPFQGRERAFTVDLDHATGLAIFYPPRSNLNAGSAYKAYIEHRLFDTTRDSGWTRFIWQGLPAQLSGDPSPMPNDVLIPPFIAPIVTSTPTPSPTPTPAPTSTNGVITTAGGTFSSSDGQIQLTFPAGAVAEAVDLTFTEQSTPSNALPTHQRALHSFTLTARTRTGQHVTHFNQPYTLVLRYSEATLTDLNLNETNLTVAFWDGTAWVAVFPCPRCRQDTSTNQITVELDHFTEFALLGNPWRVFLPVIVR